MPNSFNKALIPLVIAITLIVGGGLCTFFTASTVHVHLREGETNSTANTSFTEDFKDTLSAANTLPFFIRLDDFDIQYHEGTHTPKDYISHITIIEPSFYEGSSINENSHHDVERNNSSINEINSNGAETKVRISMNKIAKYQGYRIFQEDYDKDLLGSTLLIRYDPWGTSLVYTGFILLTLSMFWLIARRNGAFRRILRSLYLVAILLYPLSSISMPQNRNQVSGDRFQLENYKNPLSDGNMKLNLEEAEAFGQLSIYYKGRIAPFDSYARDYCKAVFPKGTFPVGYTPVQLVTEVYWFPEKWPEKPTPSMKLFPQQNLWLSPEEDLSTVKGKDTLFIAHILTWLKLSVQDENHQQNALIINSIKTFQEKRCSPGSINRQREQLEILYYQFKPEKKIFLAEILMAILWLIVLLFFSNQSTLGKILARYLVLIGLLLTLADIGLRCYLSGHNPFSGTFDTLMLVSAGILLIGFAASAKINFIALPALLTSAFITLAATLMGEQSFSPLMPVLISPWLTIHVAITMTSYCFFTLTFVMAIISIFFIIFQKEKYKNMKIKQLSQLFCILGVVFLTLGIMVGAAWANISWGQYWSWDPKETWALITLIGYCFTLPGVIPATERHDILYHLIILVAFGLLLMTYFGVNIWFGGAHAY